MFGFDDNNWASGSMGSDMLGGGQGGPMGMMGMDVSMHKMPLIGAFFQNPQEQFKQEQFHQAGQSYGAYRPEVAQARMNALRNASSAFQGANDALATMYGRGASVNPAQMFRSPMSPTMMTQGQSVTQDPGGFGASAANMFGGNQAMMGGMLPGGMPGMGGFGGF